ncbi:hypothetical protein ACJJID_02210 [Microbulbifer sp. CnH-101-G]|uniref:hypothetical protein n=1 Tax=Microbulbifer sp. CnH-101-G TaxID=3243393 RepID=UPI00403916FE
MEIMLVVRSFRNLSILLVLLVMPTLTWLSIDQYQYIPLHLDIDGDVEELDIALKVKGESFGGPLNQYQGKYQKAAKLYIDFSTALTTGNIDQAQSIALGNSASELENHRKLLLDGAKSWDETNLISIVEYDQKYVGLLEHKIKGIDFKPFRLFTIANTNEGLKVDLSRKLDTIQQELVNLGYFSRSCFITSLT